MAWGYSTRNFLAMPKDSQTLDLLSICDCAGLTPLPFSAFYGYVWSGGAGTSTGGAALPRQTWTTAPTTTTPTYDTIMSTYYQSNRYHWDTDAQTAYLNIDNSGSANDKFISYDDEHACQAKISYARNRGLGGVMIWELGSGVGTAPVSLSASVIRCCKPSSRPWPRRR